MSGTDWHGLAAMRISVSNWSTTEGDVERSVAAILKSGGDACAATTYAPDHPSRLARVLTAFTIDIRPMPFPIEMFWRNTCSTMSGVTWAT